jgi:hypothetical protein
MRDSGRVAGDDRFHSGEAPTVGGPSVGVEMWYACDVDPREEEARQRRKRWAFGVASKSNKSVAMDLAFWRGASASVKLGATRAMADEAEIIKGHATPPGLQRSVGGLRRSQG